jgi:hypothetical protein
VSSRYHRDAERKVQPGGTLEAEAIGSFASMISGFAAGDAIDAAAVDFSTGPTTVRFNAGTLTVSDGVHSAAFSHGRFLCRERFPDRIGRAWWDGDYVRLTDLLPRGPAVATRPPRAAANANAPRFNTSP